MENLVITYEAGGKKAVIRKMESTYNIQFYLGEKCVRSTLQWNEDDAKLVADMWIADNSGMLLQE